MFNNLLKFKKKHALLLSLYAFIGYYLIIRFFAGETYVAIYALIVMLLLLRYSFEKIALVFFILCIVVYVFGNYTEANHYLSFVYGFLFFSLMKYLYVIIVERFTKIKKNV